MDRTTVTDYVRCLCPVGSSIRKVNVVYGAHDMDLPLAGFTVEEIQFSLRDVLNVGMDVPAYIDGKRVGDKGLSVQAGQRIEFCSDFGNKGIGKIYTKEEFMQAFRMSEADWSDWVEKGLPFDSMRDGTIVVNETEVDAWKAGKRGQKRENLAALERMAGAAEEIARHLDPTPPEIVKSRYIAEKLGCSVKWVGDMARTGVIPKQCIVGGTGDGKQWRFYRSKIDKWLSRESA